MGLSADLTSLGWFHYIAHFDNGLTENEIDYVLVGMTDTTDIILNPEEASAYRWITLTDLTEELAATPERFTPWLLQAFEKVKTHFSNLF
jgi:isopentenyl-diphosphate delta-isomerase